MVAEKKRGGNSSPAIFMRSTAALSGVALGVVSCLTVYDPVPVHADFGNFAGAVDYITALEGASAVSSLGVGGAIVAGGILAIYCLSNPSIGNSTPFTVEGLSYVSGTYLDASQNERVGTFVVTSANSFPSDGGYCIMYGAGIDLRVTLPQNSSYSMTLNNYSSYSTVQVAGSAYYVNSASSELLISDADRPFGQFNFYDSGSPPLLTDYLEYYVNGQPIMKRLGTSTLPSGLFDPANPDSYINNVYRPWVVENYPEYVYLLPQEPEPSSEYATDDIVPGIPKDWTIINPELPTSPHLELTIPEGDFQSIDPGDTFTGFTTGVGFWWSMVNELLNTFHIKALALALLAVAVAIFAMYKIGG